MRNEIEGGGFLDPAWLERWDLVFADIYLEAMKELGVNKQIAEQTKVTLFDSTLDAADPEKYATSFPVHSLAS